MSSEETTYGLKVGQVAPDFELDSYDPNEMFFGKVSFENQKKDGKWTILFFYRRISPLFERLNLLLWQSGMSNLKSWEPNWSP